MTTKTYITMFAITAALVLSLGVTPALATHSYVVVSNVTSNGGIADSGNPPVTHELIANCFGESRVKSSTTDNWVKAYYGEDCSGTLDAFVKISGSNGEVFTHFFDNVSGTGKSWTVNTPVESGDQWEVRVTYS